MLGMSILNYIKTRKIRHEARKYAAYMYNDITNEIDSILQGSSARPLLTVELMFLSLWYLQLRLELPEAVKYFIIDEIHQILYSSINKEDRATLREELISAYNIYNEAMSDERMEKIGLYFVAKISKLSGQPVNIEHISLPLILFSTLDEKITMYSVAYKNGDL